jgi:hypothetical protein
MDAVANRHDSLALDPDLATEPRAPRPVDDPAIPYQDVQHAAFLT